jgi:hypothetical protein
LFFARSLYNSFHSFNSWQIASESPIIF